MKRKDALDRPLCRFVYNEYQKSIFDREIEPRQIMPKRWYSDTLFRLECFVEDLLSNDAIPFLPCLNVHKNRDDHPSELARTYFQWVPDFIRVVKLLSSRYQYSTHINVFISCCKALGLLPSNETASRTVHFGNTVAWYDGPDVPTNELFNQLVSTIRTVWVTNNLGDKVREKRRLCHETYKDYCDYIDALFGACVRQIVIRVDLGYQKELATGIDLYQAINDRNHLIANMRNNKIFNAKMGYIIKLEYGIEKGLHFHVLMFFDGSKRNPTSHVYHAQQIGEYWNKTIAKGRGSYWNSNAKIADFEKLGICGIGVIEADETDLIDNLKGRVLNYLCKEDQFIRPISDDRIRLICRGNFPKKTNNKLGRKRSKLPGNRSRTTRYRYRIQATIGIQRREAMTTIPLMPEHLLAYDALL